MIILKKGSIGNRLLRMNLMSIGIFFVMILAVLVVDEFIHYRNFLGENLSVQAKIIGSNSTAAIMFHDEKTAEEILSSLAGAPEVVHAFIYTKEGIPFAGYQRDNGKAPAPPVPSRYYERLEGRYFTVFQPVIMAEETIGSIYLRYDAAKFYAGVMFVIVVIIAAGFGSAYFASLLFSRLQGQITGPIMELLETMQTVRRDRNYSLRVPVRTQDELGILSSGFNDMIEQVEQWDRELSRHRQNLSDLVSDRTRQLQDVNEKLRDELMERLRVEDELRTYREELEKLVRERTAELQQTNAKLKTEIVERIRMEEELVKAQKLESLGVLAGGIAHDFNNLMTAILGNISLAKHYTDPGDKARKSLLDAENAALKTKALTYQLLTFARGGVPVKQTVSLGEMIRETAGFALRGTNVRCELCLPDDLWSVDADEGQISQVIQNLVINAQQAMPEGGTISVGGENVVLDTGDMLPLVPGRYIRISVQDHGIGIPREHIAKIFDPYFTTKQQGSGLGLASAYSIIKRHDGHLAVESAIGVGTTFYIYLPASESAAVPSAGKPEGLLIGTGKVLIMDDEEQVRTVAGRMLEETGYTVEFARDGAEAITLFRSARDSGVPFDCVIMDLTIPGGMGGKEAIQRLIEIDPKVKAVVSSGYSNDPVMADFRKYGFSGCVVKPYRISEICDTLSKVIRGMPLFEP